MSMSFKRMSDFWDNFDRKKVFEILWDIYNDFTEEKKDLLEAVNKSKSISTVPYEIKRRWKKFRFRELENNITSLTETGDEILTRIPSETETGEPNILNEDLEPVDIELSPVLPPERDRKVVKMEADRAIGMELAEKVEEYPKGTIITEEMSDLGEVKVRNKYVIEVDGPLEKERQRFWIKEYYIHNPIIVDYHGVMVGADNQITDVNIYSRQYLNMIKALWYILVEGPTMRNLEVSVLLFLGLPVTLVEGVKIEIWEPGHVRLSNGDEWFFPDSYPLISSYEKNGETHPITGEGQTLPQFTPLIDNVDIYDYIENPEYEGIITEPGRLDIEKYSTLAIEISDDLSEAGYTPNASQVETFLKRITPQYLIFDILWNFVTGVYYEYSVSSDLVVKFYEQKTFYDFLIDNNIKIKYKNEYPFERKVETKITHILERKFNGREIFNGKNNFDGDQILYEEA